MPIGRNITYYINKEDLEFQKDTSSTDNIKGSLIFNLLTNQGNPDLYINCNQPAP
jgi:hypothetical protein